MASLAATFGRGAMTNHWKDIKNTDVVLVMGANPAENHPCGFKWAVDARDNRGAKLLTIDPRFTRTSAVADRHMQIRPGSDIAVLGGLIRYALENDLYHADYVRAHTNATFVVGEEYGFADGLFAGFDEAASNYDKTAWDYERGGDGYVRRDPALAHPRSVFQLLKQHYDRYTPEVVADIAGCSARRVPADGRDHLLDGPGRPGRDDHVRGRLDHAHGRQPDNPHRGDPAAAAREHRPAGRGDSTPCAGTPTCRGRPTTPSSPASCRAI